MATARNVPSGVIREIERSQSADPLLVFLEFTHDTLSTPIRVVSDPIDHVYGGNTFTGFLFRITLLSDDSNAPFAQLKIQNVDRSIGETLRKITVPAQLAITVIAASEFDQTVDPRTEIATAATVYTASNLYLVDVEVNAMEITGRLTLWDYSQETWPAKMATQDRLPGLFR